MHWTDRLSEYLDGELTPAEHAACDRHLASCATCRGALEDIRAVISRVRADVGHLPATDLWPAIASRIGHAAAEADLSPGVAAPIAFKPRTSVFNRQVTIGLPQLALAASLLIAVSSAVAYIAAGRLTPRTTTAAAPNAPVAIQAVAEATLPPSPGVAPANFADAQFESAVADLERILEEQRDQLDPRTVMVIERNLAAIDEAIRQARAALKADPANTFLNSHLADARRRKLDLLRQATTIAGD